MQQKDNQTTWQTHSKSYCRNQKTLLVLQNQEQTQNGLNNSFQLKMLNKQNLDQTPKWENKSMNSSQITAQHFFNQINQMNNFTFSVPSLKNNQQQYQKLKQLQNKIKNLHKNIAQYRQHILNFISTFTTKFDIIQKGWNLYCEKSSSEIETLKIQNKKLENKISALFSQNMEMKKENKNYQSLIKIESSNKFYSQYSLLNQQANLDGLSLMDPALKKIKTCSFLTPINHKSVSKSEIIEEEETNSMINYRKRSLELHEESGQWKADRQKQNVKSKIEGMKNKIFNFEKLSRQSL